MSVNRVILVGNLGADPELKRVGDNRAVCNLSVATNESYKDKDGQRQDRTEWHRVTAWGETAENCAKYLTKGRTVYVEGKLQTRSYDKDGQKHYATDVVAERVVFVGKGDGERGAANAKPEERKARNWGGKPVAREPGSDDGLDDIPL